MITIESTPEMVERVYRTSESNLKMVRRRLGKPLTLGEKVLFGHLADPEHQELKRGASYLSLRPDRVVFQDVLGQTGMLQFLQTGRSRVAVPTTIHCDHLVQARVEGVADLAASVTEDREIYDFLRSAAAKVGAGFWGPGAGIIHQVVLENYAFPGQLILGTDSHTPNAGGLGACAVGVGGADAVEAIAGLPWEVMYPKAIGVYLTGRLNGWTSAKDVILWVLSQLGVSGATNSIVEYIGPGARTLPATGKATIANMGAELGATTSVFPVDGHMARYLEATGRGGLAPLLDQYRDLLEPDAEVEARPEQYYDRVLKLDLSELEPYVAGPHSPDRARPLSELCAEARNGTNGLNEDISAVLIGSCTNSSYEDLSRAAQIAAQAKAHQIEAATRFFVTPGSERIRARTERDGQLQALRDIGGIVLANACGPCIGQWKRQDTGTEPNTIVSSYNRNFPARNDGRASTMNLLVSPEIATAMAIAGRLTFNPVTDFLEDAAGRPFRLSPPEAPELPADGLGESGSGYAPPPTNGTEVLIEIQPGSERLQALTPWPAWDGHDFLDLPVLLKTKGKTTTDQISPAGRWLRYRGHLERFSDNLFLGAVNAFTGTTGTTGRQSIAALARHYRAQGTRWVVIGDHNYGEGSSREHAALSPRLLGGAAVIARSFARIHESNLKKQGLLALTFSAADDYDEIREGDRISLVGLAELAPSRTVECRVQHLDGTSRTLFLRHSYSAGQVDWFRAGSAVNCASRRLS